MGALPPEIFRPDLDTQGFRAVVDAILQAYDSVLVMEAEKPMGLAVISVENSPRFERPHVWPHFQWFPWSKARDRLECAVRFIEDMRKEFLLIAVCVMEDKKLFERVCDLGMGKRVGTIEGWFRKGDRVAIFNSWSG